MGPDFLEGPIDGQSKGRGDPMQGPTGGHSEIFFSSRKLGKLTGGGCKEFLFSPLLFGNLYNLAPIFSTGLVQPPILGAGFPQFDGPAYLKQMGFVPTTNCRSVEKSKIEDGCEF